MKVKYYREKMSFLDEDCIWKLVDDKWYECACWGDNQWMYRDTKYAEVVMNDKGRDGMFFEITKEEAFLELL